MGNAQVIKKINYEDMQNVIKSPDIYLIINTLPHDEQNCLITNTTLAQKEEEIINKLLYENKGVRIIIYGRNSNDENVNKKCNQLQSLGFYNIFLYTGGMFEWLLLQDIYGNDLFPTTKKEVDILKFKSTSILTIGLLEN